MSTARKLLSNALFGVAERVAPAPEVKPWPFALGVASVAAFALYAYELRESLAAWFARVAETSTRLDALAKANVDEIGRLISLERDFKSWTSSWREVYLPALTVPKPHETFAAFRCRAPQALLLTLWWGTDDDAQWRDVPVPGACPAAPRAWRWVAESDPPSRGA